MKRLVTTFLVLTGLLVIARSVQALSPFVTQPQITAPVQGASLNCVTVQVTTTSWTQVLPANAVREALYVTNVSTTPINGSQSRSSVVWLSTANTTSLAGNLDPGTIASGLGLPLFPFNYSTAGSTNVVVGSSRWEDESSAIYQGPVFATGDCGTAGGACSPHVNACEMNP